MPHCKSCKFESDREHDIIKHHNERKHKGICEGKFERVMKDNSSYLTRDSQLVCFTCSAVVLEPYYPTK